MALSRSQWVELARRAILEVLDRELAAPWIEIEARLADDTWPGQTRKFDPHILTLARSDLAQTGQINDEERTTRGGGEVRLLTPNPIPPRRKRAAETAAGRKRLLTARWRSWGRQTDRTANLIGAGGEAVVHSSLRDAAVYGYRLVQPTRGEVATLFGEPIPGGALDNAAWLSPMDVATQTPSGQSYLVPIEVKNVRHWLYPNHDEVFQLLHKAAALANGHPEHPVLPILVCRRNHYRLRLMAQDLGFLMFQTYDQYVRPSDDIDPEHFEEVRAELHLTSLQLTDQTSHRLVDWLAGAPQREAADYSQRWMTFSRHQEPIFGALRNDQLRWRDQVALLSELRGNLETTYGASEGNAAWASEP